MKKIIDGKVYDTNTATLMGGFSAGIKGDFFRHSKYLFQTEFGELFIYTKSRDHGEDIVPYGGKD